MYKGTREFTIEPHCPWYEAQQTYGAPNVNWCEPTRCALINEPANTWSNLPYLLVGVLIYQKLSHSADRVMKELGWAIFLMGLFSFIYHATNNFLTQLFDFVGMYLMTSLVLSLQLKRICEKSSSHYNYFWAAMFFNLLIFWIFHLNNIAIQHTVAIQGVCIFAAEIWGRRKLSVKPTLKYFWLAILSLAVAQTFSILDLQRIYCVPENTFFHGHAIWHIVGAVGMWMLAKHVKVSFVKN